MVTTTAQITLELDDESRSSNVHVLIPSSRHGIGKRYADVAAGFVVGCLWILIGYVSPQPNAEKFLVCHAYKRSDNSTKRMFRFRIREHCFCAPSETTVSARSIPNWIGPTLHSFRSLSYLIPSNDEQPSCLFGSQPSRIGSKSIGWT